MPRESKKPRGAVVKEALREAKIKFKTASSNSHFIVKISERFSLSVQCLDYIFDYDFLQSLRGSREPSPEHLRLMAQRAENVAETALLDGSEVVYIKKLGYDGVRTWKSVSQLVKHILSLQKKLQ